MSETQKEIGRTELRAGMPQKESQGPGTGEKYIGSTGVKADGGDFDAANAGAGMAAGREFYLISFPSSRFGRHVLITVIARSC